MTVEHHADRRRFESPTEHGTAYLSYERSADGKVLDLQHTVVPEAAQGQGVGEGLVKAALDHAREDGLRVIPTCAFVNAWMRRHPETAPLLAR